MPVGSEKVRRLLLLSCIHLIADMYIANRIASYYYLISQFTASVRCGQTINLVNVEGLSGFVL